MATAQEPTPTPEPIGDPGTVTLSEIVREDAPSTAPLASEAPPVLEIASGASAAAAPPAEPAAPGDAMLTFEERYLAKIERSYEKIETVRAHFTQRFLSPLFMDETTAPCDLYVRKPGGFHMSYGGDDKTQHWIYQDHYWMYDPEHGTVDKVPISPNEDGVESLNLMLLGFDLDAREVFKVYHVHHESTATLDDGSTSTTLRLEPLQSDLKLRFLRLSFVESPSAEPEDGESAPDSPDAAVADEVVEADMESAEAAADAAVAVEIADSIILPRHIYYEEGFDADQIDEKEIIFESIELNVPLDDELFEPIYPDDVDFLTQ